MESVALKSNRNGPEFDDQDGVNSTKIKKHPPTTIITCPSCVTRFAVQTQSIVEIEDPHFHCSRCDALFGLSEVTLAPQGFDYNDSEKQLEAENYLAQDLYPSEQYREEVFQETSPAREEQVSLSNDLLEAPSAKLFEELPSLSVDKLSLSAKESTRIEDRYANAFNTSLNHFSITPSSEPQTTNHYQEERYNFSESSRKTDAQINESSKKRASSRLVGSKSSSLYFFSLIVSTLFALALLTVLIRNQPSLFAGLFETFVPTALKPSSQIVPPNTLVISKSRLEWIKLTSGEVLPVIFGKLSNKSDESYSSVEIEGLLFNNRSELISAQLSPLKSALAKEKIADLSLNNIERMQPLISGKASDISLNQELNFVVAFPSLARSPSDLKPIGVRSYSVRVYQVTK